MIQKTINYLTKNTNLLNIFIIFSLTLLLSGMWFKEKTIMGVAEDGLTFYNLERYLTESQYSWTEHPGLGRPSFNNVAGKPTFLALLYMQNIGIKNYILQAGLIFIFFAASGIAIYFLLRDEFKVPDAFALLSVLFYWFNPMSLSNVWNRFLLNYLFFWTLLPVAIFLYVRGISTKKYKWAFFLTIALGIFSYTFTFYVFTAVLWMTVLIFTLVNIFLEKKKSKFILTYFFLSLGLFIFTNLWWITQFISYVTSPGHVASNIYNFSSQVNTSTLEYLSKALGKWKDILALRNASFFAQGRLDWIDQYNNPVLNLLNYFPVLIVLILPFITKIKKELKLWYVMFFVSIFLIRGINFPFGFIYKFIFERVSYLQVFRNPLEKFGFLYILIVSILFGYGSWIIFKYLTLVKRMLFICLCLITLFYWTYPFFTGLVFTNTFKPTDDEKIGYKVKVPDYYKQANSWLNEKEDNFRIVGLPIANEGITYNWEKGYAGLELSTALFDKTAIMHKTSVQYFSEVADSMEIVLNESSDSEFSNTLNILNTRYLFVRDDIDYELRSLTPPSELVTILNKKEKVGLLKKNDDFEKLYFWENTSWQDTTIYPANKVKDTDQIYSIGEAKTIDPLKGEVLLYSSTKQEYMGSEGLLPKVSYVKNNPANYTINIVESREPFVLVFSEKFDERWNLSEADSDNTFKRHFLANAYANAWIVDKSGDYELILNFLPQESMTWGENISLYTYITVVLIALFIIIKEFFYSKLSRSLDKRFRI